MLDQVAEIALAHQNELLRCSMQMEGLRREARAGGSPTWKLRKWLKGLITLLAPGTKRRGLMISDTR